MEVKIVINGEAYFYDIEEEDLKTLLEFAEDLENGLITKQFVVPAEEEEE